MGCKIKFIDGEELEITNAESSEIDEDFTLIKDKEDEIIYELNNSVVRYIKWD